MSRARSEAPERDAVLIAAGERISVGLRGLLGRVERATGSVATAAAKGRGRAAEAAGGLRRSAPLRHALAAIERGNLEAALALLREAVELAPEDSESVLALWNVALACERPELTGPAMARWIHTEASAGRHDRAVDYWIELAERVPGQRVDAPTLVRMLPELRSRVSGAADTEQREKAETWLRCALRQSVEPDARGLTPGLALRVFEQARILDAETARRAGEIVLAASDVHENKRRNVETLLAQLDAPEQARPAAAPTPDPIDATPVELSETGLIVLESGSGRRARVDLRSVEAIAVARVGGLGPEPALLIDLILRRPPRSQERRIFRLRADAFDPAAVLSDVAPGEDPLGALLGALLDRSGAVPLPDPDSALGIEPRWFESLDDYEGAVLARVSEREDASEAP